MPNKNYLFVLIVLLACLFVCPVSAEYKEYIARTSSIIAIEINPPANSIIEYVAADDEVIIGFQICDTDVHPDNRTISVDLKDGTTKYGFVNTTIIVPYITSYSEFNFDGYFVNSTNPIPWSMLGRGRNGYAYLGVLMTSAGYKNISIWKGLAVADIPYDYDLLYNGMKHLKVVSTNGDNFETTIWVYNSSSMEKAYTSWDFTYNPETTIYDTFMGVVGFITQVITFLYAIVDLIFIQGFFILIIALIELGFTAYAANNSKDVFVFFQKWIRFNVKFFVFLIETLERVLNVIISIINTINPLKWILP